MDTERSRVNVWPASITREGGAKMRQVLSVALLLGTVVVLLSGAAKADVFLADYLGYDYTWPLPNDFISPGQKYAALGFVPQVNQDYIAWDPSLEYTFHIHSGELTLADTVGVFLKLTYEDGDGTFQIWKDSPVVGTPADYGVNPPNGTAPSTFTDGTLVLGGTFGVLTILVNMDTFDGSLSGTIDFDSGSDLPNIPPGMQDGWTFAGFGWDYPGIPEGYTWQIDGEVYLPEPTPVRQTSWGELKREHK
jgi:hypothetical protein